MPKLLVIEDETQFKSALKALESANIEVGLFNSPMDGFEAYASKVERLNLYIEEKNRTFSNTVKYIRSILDSQRSYVAIFDKAEIIDGNQRFLMTFGFGDVEELRSAFLLAYCYGSGERLECPEFIANPDWLLLLLTQHYQHLVVVMEVEGVKRHFEIEARSTLYRSGVSDEVYEEHNLIVLNLTEITALINLIESHREQDHLLIQQSRQAAVGEMINNIAHQWRQPLNVVGLLLEDLVDTHHDGGLDNGYLEESVQNAIGQIEYMSETISSFMNFFKPEKIRRVFDVSEVVDNSIGIVKQSFLNSGIMLQSSIATSYKIEGYPNELLQVLVNLYNNAKDAIEGRDQKGEVCIEAYNEKGRVVIGIGDNGGGIPESLLEKIFDPYFTTKNKTQGTGIGLYMSKKIIEDSMEGHLEVCNKKGGAYFTITLPALPQDQGHVVPV